MSQPTQQEEWAVTYENEIDKFIEEFGYTPSLDEFVKWYLEGDVRLGGE